MLASVGAVQKFKIEGERVVCPFGIQPMRRPAMGRNTPMLLNADDLPEILTARELEAFLRIDVKTIYAYVQDGRIPYVRIQSNLRFLKREILAWLEERHYRP
jgi:excisionase family DNA binding protein